MLNFKKKYDYKNCLIYIKSGSGGIDSKDWIKILANMYIKWAKINNLKINIKSKFNFNNIKNNYFILYLNGNNPYKWFNKEDGIHKLIRFSPFNSSKKRHTSFASVSVYYKFYKNNKIIINNKDIKIDTFKSSGSGGQHVNKTESSIRITHIPTGLIVNSKNNKSQNINKKNALKKLKIKLNYIKNNKINIDKKNINISKLEISWSNHIRTYILDKSIIKDLKTGIKIKNIKSILNGNLKKFY